MIRVTNPVASLQFYKLLGMSVLQEFKLPDFGLDLYFLAYGAYYRVSDPISWSLELT